MFAERDEAAIRWLAEFATASEGSQEAFEQLRELNDLVSAKSYLFGRESFVLSIATPAPAGMVRTVELNCDARNLGRMVAALDRLAGLRAVLKASGQNGAAKSRTPGQRSGGANAARG